LERDDAEDNILGQWLWAAELGDLELLDMMIKGGRCKTYLRVCFDDRLPTGTMWLLGVCPEEMLVVSVFNWFAILGFRVLNVLFDP
jgi:hypothetical protein